MLLTGSRIMYQIPLHFFALEMTTVGMSVIGNVYYYVFIFSYKMAFCYLRVFVKVLVRNIHPPHLNFP